MLARPSRARVNTLLDEQRLACARFVFALLLPIPEIQYSVRTLPGSIARRGATLQFSRLGVRQPDARPIASFAIKGLRRSFPHDIRSPFLRAIRAGGPVPARADTRSRVRTAVALSTDPAVVVLLEPIVLYHMRDLHAARRGGRRARARCRSLLAPRVYRPVPRSGDRHLRNGVCDLRAARA